MTEDDTYHTGVSPVLGGASGGTHLPDFPTDVFLVRTSGPILIFTC